MPEIAEVETVRRHLDKALHGKKIKEVIYEEKDRHLFAFVSAKAVKKALEGARITGTGRKGKYFWLELDRKPWPLFHLGMSGNVSLLTDPSDAKHRNIWGGKRLWSLEDESEHSMIWFCRLLLRLERKIEMAFSDPRRFGRMWLTEDPWQHPRIAKLGFDPLLDFPTGKDLYARLHKRKKSIKAVMLDQGLFAGIGNWLGDEILFQARISPHRLASELSPAEVVTLRKVTLAVVKKAVAVDADYERFPKTWLFHERWGKSKTAKTHKGHKIKHEEIAGRTTAWVPDWQS
ncbi:Fpg/Nei family DNA glycosylase [Bdellovibrio bacteriovorus]|uniref:Fpg/Nei family DNA glycosylase n=1 Tax=Bdellovibrio bacteriovorus TaxID=959 RepID=UPI0035A6382E